MAFQSSTISFMDGVPVKISEKYKPPPKVTIPQSIINRLNSEGYPNGIFDYDFTLEKKVIKKIDEWKKVRELERQQRQERLRKYEIEKARANEEREKLLLTAVSYPNADDLSSGDEESPENSGASGAAGSSSGNSGNSTINTNQPQQFSPLQQTCFDTILMPTVVPDYNININNMSPIYQQKNSHKNAIYTCDDKLNNGNSINSGDGASGGNKINYSDFENDTSSPFDNIELKTINDLDVLAQVLNVTQIHSTQNFDTTNNPIQPQLDQQQQNVQECQTNNKKLTNFNNDYYRNSSNNTPTNELIGSNQQLTNANQWNTTNLDNSNQMNHVVHHTLVNNAKLYYPSNIYYSTNYENKSAVGGTTQLQNYANINDGGQTPMVMNNQQIESDLQRNTTNYYYNNLPNNQNYLYNSYPIEIQRNNLNVSVGNAQNFINQQPQTQQHQPVLFYHNNTELINNEQRDEHNFNAYEINNTVNKNVKQGTTKSKSKSVPDILQELNDEIRDSELRRARNHSQTLEDHIDKKNDNSDKKEKPKIFLKLSPSLQSLVQNISSMGFPIERVANIAIKLGNDDKKIFEHLIPLTELLDLGFDESKISDALLKFDNNKEKALDFLIS